MIDKKYEFFVDLFEEFGDPSLWKKKYNVDANIKGIYDPYYRAYNSGTLKLLIMASDMNIPRVKERYSGNIEDLIDKLKAKENIDSAEVIHIPDEINSIKELNKLKDTFPDKKILIRWNGETALIEDVISAVYMIDYFKSIIDESMSPLEKITMAYDIVKSHYYKDSEKKYTVESRRITEMVNNSFIVCVGYVRIFNRILKELGITALNLALSNSKEMHARSVVKVEDEKYGINGYFVFDPTYDSAGHRRYYIFDGDKARYYVKKVEGYKESDPLSLYYYYLVPLKLYEKYFPDSCYETLTLKDNSKLSEKATHKLLHMQQYDKKIKRLSAKAFVKLLYKVKLAEGYNIDNIPNIIQESLFISGYGAYSLKVITEVIDSIKESANQK